MQEFGQRDDGNAIFAFAGEAEELGGEFAGIFSDAADFIQMRRDCFRVVGVDDGGGIDMAEDGVDVIVEVMGDTAGKEAEGFEPLGVVKLFEQGIFFCGELEFAGDISADDQQEAAVAEIHRRDGGVDGAFIPGFGVTDFGVKKSWRIQFGGEVDFFCFIGGEEREDIFAAQIFRRAVVKEFSGTDVAADDDAVLVVPEIEDCYYYHFGETKSEI